MYIKCTSNQYWFFCTITLANSRFHCFIACSATFVHLVDMYWLDAYHWMDILHYTYVYFAHVAHSGAKQSNAMMPLTSIVPHPIAMKANLQKRSAPPLPPLLGHLQKCWTALGLTKPYGRPLYISNWKHLIALIGNSCSTKNGSSMIHEPIYHPLPFLPLYPQGYQKRLLKSRYSMSTPFPWATKLVILSKKIRLV